MSRIGKKPIALPKGVTVKIAADAIEVQGPKGKLRQPIPPGVVFARESEQWPGDQWALRVEQTGRSVDWSASYFDGKDLAPDLGMDVAAGLQARTGAPVIRLSHHRVRVIGGDMTANLGRFGLRAEGAYVHTEDTQGRDPFTKNPFLFVVVGGDRTFDGRLNVNVQYLGRAVVRFRRPPTDLSSEVAPVAQAQAILSSQTRRVQHGASMRASYKWLHETLETEWAAVAYAGPRGVAMRPKVTYAVTDRFTVMAGAEVFRGEDASVFRLLRPNSTVFLEARLSFRASR